MSLNRFEAIATGNAARANSPLIPDVSGPAQEIPKVFPYQSYFDDTLLSKALLAQTMNQPIVPSTLTEQQVSGYAIGLHPSSETPVAVSFKIGGQRTSSAPLILKPGQIMRPHGKPDGAKVSGNFSGFQWGLPFGWLGGGLARLVVFQSPDAHAYWTGNPEVVFHRQRMQILAPAGVSSVPYNWPARFPWTQALQGSSSVPQKGAPGIVIQPSRVMLRLRLNTLAAPQTMRFIIQNTQTFDLNSAGVVTADSSFVEMVWPSYVATGSTGALANPYCVQEAPSELLSLGADDGGIQLVDMSASTLTNAYVDVVRYGRL